MAQLILYTERGREYVTIIMDDLTDRGLSEG